MTADTPPRPPDIAREALRRLALERVPPTPDNYRAYYERISGAPAEEPFPERALRMIAKELPRNTTQALKVARQFEDAVAAGQWQAVRHAVVGICEGRVDGVAPWAPLVRQLLVQLMRHGIAPMVEEDAVLAQEVQGLADVVTQLDESVAPPDLAPRLQALSTKLDWTGEEQRAIRRALLGLLRLVVANISELVVDDSWLRGQLSVIAEAFSGPLDIRVLDEAERRLRDVIDKQGVLKRELTDAQARLKAMLSGFVDRLARFSTTTGDYHDTLERCAREIAEAKDISALTNVVEEMLRETREAQQSARRSGEELAALRLEVESANSRIARLQRELDETSELVRHDPLTGVLNRKGLDEALVQEIARIRRRSASLCLVLLDVDNFKHINDTYGHKTGDDALRHLASVVRESLRPQDAVGRYGGEEFLIVLPETDLQHANVVITRLQRKLTKRFFLAGNQRVLITFSAGISCLGPDETPDLAIDRADKAMYAAKRAGKNRVLTAD